MLSQKIRDVSFIRVGTDIITIACDSCGGIGSSERDVVSVSNEMVGYCTLRVPLFETLAVRSTPLHIVNTLSVEMNDRGKQLLQGMYELMEEYNNAHFHNKLSKYDITGSTEENVPTIQTALGVTVIGKQEKTSSYIHEEGDHVVVIGEPLVGYEVMHALQQKQNTVVSLASLKSILQYCHDVLPVGSKGIGYEVTQLHIDESLCIQHQHHSIDMIKSAGPSTCVIATIHPRRLDYLRAEITEQITIIGDLIKKARV